MAGRQNSFVDLKFTGDLQQSITTREDNGDYEIVVLGRENAEKLSGNEKRFKAKIGEPTKDEKSKFISRTTRTIQKSVLDAIKNKKT